MLKVRIDYGIISRLTVKNRKLEYPSVHITPIFHCADIPINLTPVFHHSDIFT